MSGKGSPVITSIIYCRRVINAKQLNFYAKTLKKGLLKSLSLRAGSQSVPLLTAIILLFSITPIGFRQQRDKLLFAGMAGDKCVTMACNYRNTFGFSLWNDCHWQSSYFDSLRDAPHTVSLPYTNRFLTHWRGSAQGSLV